MLTICNHRTGDAWQDDNVKEVARVRAVSDLAVKDGSLDGIVLTTKIEDTTAAARTDWSNDGDKFVITTDSVEDVNGLIRALGQLKSRLLKAQNKKRTVYE